MIRATLLVIVFVAGIATPDAPLIAQIKQEGDRSKPTTAAPSLKVGDLAPRLKVDKWLQGEPVSKFQPGKVYVIDFWATWCGACIRGMPHLAQLEAQYKSKGLTIISFTSRDMLGSPAGNGDEKVAAFARKRAPLLGYRFGYSYDETMCDAWMKAADRHHLACIFVVDQAGRVAYIGGPLFLDLALQKVLAGDTNAKTIGDEMARVEADYQALCADINRDQKAFFQRDPEIFFQALGVFEAKYPLLADCLPVTLTKLMLLLKRENLDEAERYAEKLMAKAIEQRNVFLLEALNVILSEKKEKKELLLLALRAAESLVVIDGDTNSYSLLRLAEIYSISGDKAKAKECARKAIDAAAGESPASQKEIENEARRFGAEK